MRVGSRQFGQASLALVVLGLSYYTAWVMLLPFVEPQYLPLVDRSSLHPATATLQVYYEATYPASFPACTCS